MPPADSLDAALEGRQILIVEDEYLVAADLADELETAGARVIGPVGSVRAALAVIAERGKGIDAASLDVNLAGDVVYPVADALTALAIPFVFCTGYDQRAIPSQYHNVVRCEKPVETRAIVRALCGATAR